MGYFTAMPHIKRIHVYTNGDPNAPGVNFIVHPRRLRNYEVFLRDLTEKIKPSFGAVRNVYTPVNGSRVRDLEDLENHQNYVAAGHEPFRKFRYIDIENVQARKRAVKTVTPPKPPQRIRKTLRRKRPYSWEPIHIYVYRNGDDVSPALRLTVRRSDVDNWEQLLLSVGDRLDLTGYVKRLYNLNGDWVRGPTGVRNGQYYVAVGGYEAFRNVMYGQLLEKLPRDFLNRPSRASDRSASPPKSNQKKKGATVKAVPKIKVPTSPPAKKPNKKAVEKADNRGGGVGTSHREDKNNKRGNRPRERPEKNTPATKNVKNNIATTTTTIITPPKVVKNNRPQKKATAGADEKEDRRKRVGNLKDKRSPPDSEDSAYISENEKRHKNRQTKPHRRSFEVINGVPPSRSAYYAADKQRRPKKVTLVDYDEDKSGIYKAKRPNSHTKYAREVQEMQNIPVDLPIDEVEATEVGEEIYEEGHHTESNRGHTDDHGYTINQTRPHRIRLQSAK